MVRAMLYPPSHADLVDKALHYLKQVNPNCYRTMTDAERQQYSEDSAKRAERYARILISQGVFESTAWSTSIREMILGTESD